MTELRRRGISIVKSRESMSAREMNVHIRYVKKDGQIARKRTSFKNLVAWTPTYVLFLLLSSFFS